MNKKCVLTVEQTQSENASKVAKIKEYFKTQLYFMVIFVLVFCLQPVVLQLQGVVDFLSPMFLFEAICSNTMQDNVRNAVVSGICLLFLVCLVFVFQIIRCLLVGLILLIGVDIDEPNDSDLDPIIWVFIFGAPIISMMLFYSRGGYVCTLIEIL